MQDINRTKIYNRLIDENTYSRIKDFNPDDNMQNNYKNFIDWNKNFINRLSQYELEFLSTLCDMIANDYVRSMDEECCAKMHINAFYYTTEHRLVIVTPR
jgi:hypothetical protein